MTMRAFIGVDFSKEMKAAISSLQDKLRPYASYGRWKYIDNFHLTLKFLDEVNDGKVDEIGDRLKSICQENKRFVLNVNEIGKFQGKSDLRVLWLGLGGDLDKLNRLQQDIENRMHSLGFSKEKRPYVPHITIAQDILFTMDFSQIMKIAAEMSFPEISVEKVCLFKSEQIGRKRVYTPIREHALG